MHVRDTTSIGFYEREKNLIDIIIKHLQKKKDHQDDLEGILLIVYEKELKNLSGEILTAICDLVSQGILMESKNSSGQKCYQLSDSFFIK